MGDTPFHDDPIAPTVERDYFYDILLVGGGPACLAVAARLFEPVPAALYTEAEHERLEFLKAAAARRAGKPNFVKKSQGQKSTQHGHALWGTGDDRQETIEPRVCMVDKVEDRWLGQWNRQFAAYEIEHLRSPMFFHVAANEVDALIAYAEETGRQDELAEIRDVIGRELSKHKQKRKNGRAYTPIGLNQRSKKDYYRPSTSLFCEFTQERVIRRSGLNCHGPHEEGRIHTLKGTVAALTFGCMSVIGTGEGQTLEQDVFRIRLEDGTLLGARAVVVGVGNGGQLSIPPALCQSPSEKPRPFGDGWCHSAALCLPGYGFPIPKRPDDVLLVIGGGLTSAQVVQAALKHGWSKVALVMRGWLKVKHFDLDLQWVGKYQNLMKAIFWQESCPKARLAHVREARNGGSVNPAYAQRLKEWERDKKMELLTWTQIQDATWDGQQQSWTVKLETCTPEPSQKKAEMKTTGPKIQTRISQFGFIIAATGAKLDVARLPFVAAGNLIPEYPPATPPETIVKDTSDYFPGGLPWLTHDLQWNSDLPLFFVGAFAALQIGPGAANLSGARDAAERVVERLEELGLGVRRTGKAWSSFSRIRYTETEEHLDSDTTVAANRWEALAA